MARVVWYGHASFLLGVDGVNILIDPWVTNPLSPYRDVADFTKDVKSIDYIVVTHDHADHVGNSIELLQHYTTAKLVALYELANDIGERAGATDRAVGANIGGPVRLPNITMVFTPAHHSSSRGDPSGVVILGREATVYHAGDTGLFAEMSLLGELYGITLALLPIGGHFTMGTLEAAKAVELLRPKYVIPMHYNTFDVIRADPNEFAGIVRARGLPTNVVVLKPGEEFSF